MLSIMRPMPIAAIASAGTVAGVNPSFLLTPDPKEAMTAAYTANGQNTTLNVDMGATTILNTAFLGYTNLPVSAAFSMAVYAANSSYTPTGGALATVNPADTILYSPRPHLFAQFSDTASRYWVIQINDLTGGALAAQFGTLAVGKAFTPSRGREYGSGRGIDDSGSASRNPAGGFAIDPGAITPNFGWTLGDLTDSEVQTMYAIAMDRGETNSVLIVEDSDNSYAGLGDRIHWGLFGKFERYERFAPGATRWGLSVMDWA